MLTGRVAKHFEQQLDQTDEIEWWMQMAPDIGHGQRDGVCPVCRTILTRRQLDSGFCDKHKEEDMD